MTALCGRRWSCSRAYSAGCALQRDPAEVTDGEVRIWVLPAQESGTDVGVGGIVEYVEEQRCFVFVPDALPAEEDPADHYQAVLWPRGTGIVSGSSGARGARPRRGSRR